MVYGLLSTKDSRLRKNDKKKKEYNIKKNMQKILINNEHIRDVKNIASGAYAPLTGFLRKGDFQSVLDKMRLENGKVWPIPIVLDVPTNEIEENVLLVSEEGEEIALLKNTEVFENPKEEFAEKVFGTIEIEHPGVKHVMEMQDYLVGGEIELITHPRMEENTLLPHETKEEFAKRGWKNIVAFQTRNPPHRSHEYLQKSALEHTDGLFINPVIGQKKAGDFHDDAIFGAYEKLVEHYYHPEKVFLGGLSLRMRYAGPREALLHALIRKNFGCTHFIVGRDHAGVGDYYGTYDAQKIFDEFDKAELGIEIFPLEHAAYCKTCAGMASMKSCPHHATDWIMLSGTKVRDKFQKGEEIPGEFMRPEVTEYLKGFEDPFVG